MARGVFGLARSRVACQHGNKVSPGILNLEHPSTLELCQRHGFKSLDCIVFHRHPLHLTRETCMTVFIALGGKSGDSWVAKCPGVGPKELERCRWWGPGGSDVGRMFAYEPDRCPFLKRLADRGLRDRK